MGERSKGLVLVPCPVEGCERALTVPALAPDGAVGLCVCLAVRLRLTWIYGGPPAYGRTPHLTVVGPARGRTYDPGAA